MSDVVDEVAEVPVAVVAAAVEAVPNDLSRYLAVADGTAEAVLVGLSDDLALDAGAVEAVMSRYLA